ncbi:hypothetical protein C8F01DRAFT_979491 [Mycena amicta]|nr:hypothetical protein C8F01DRAFT_979491 [Mycena amicta]
MPSTASTAPTEIWRLIVQFATSSENSYDVEYEPFQLIQELQETTDSQQHERRRLQTCLSLTLVSRRCRALAAGFLYEDVRIYDATGLASLMHSLIRSASEDGDNAFGLSVRRLELPCRRVRLKPNPYSPSQPFPTHPIPDDPAIPALADLLALCPRLDILVRPCLPLDTPNISFWANLIGAAIVKPLQHLRRLEWHETELDPRFYGSNNSARLRELVALAPNLRYLYLSSDRSTALADLSLPATLDTLRLNRSHFPSVSTHRPTRLPLRSCNTVSPAVRHLVLHTALPSALLDFVETTGTQLRVLELAFAPQMAFSGGHLRRILARTPALEELVYYLGAPEIAPLGGGVQAPSIKRVRLKVNREEWNPCKPVLRSQMEVLEGASFPELEEIILHDPTKWFLRRELGREMVRRMLRRGCAVNYEDGTTVEIPV